MSLLRSKTDDSYVCYMDSISKRVIYALHMSLWVLVYWVHPLKIRFHILFNIFDQHERSMDKVGLWEDGVLV